VSSKRGFSAGVVLSAGMAGLALTALCAGVSQADTGEEERTWEYLAQDHSPKGEGCLVFDLERPCEPIPEEMVPGINDVLLSCEVKGWWSRWNSPAEVISPTEDYGIMQLSWRHAEAMALAGLDFNDEHHRVKWGVRLWERYGWSPTWSCAK